MSRYDMSIKAASVLMDHVHALKEVIHDIHDGEGDIDEFLRSLTEYTVPLVERCADFFAGASPEWQ